VGGESPSQQLYERRIFIFLKHDLVEQFFGENFLLFSRQRENIWQSFNDHGKRLTEERSKLQTLLFHHGSFCVDAAELLHELIELRDVVVDVFVAVLRIER
jgi:hypothetical protein